MEGRRPAMAWEKNLVGFHSAWLHPGNQRWIYPGKFTWNSFHADSVQMISLFNKGRFLGEPAVTFQLDVPNMAIFF